MQHLRRLCPQPPVTPPLTEPSNAPTLKVLTTVRNDVHLRTVCQAVAPSYLASVRQVRHPDTIAHNCHGYTNFYKSKLIHSPLAVCAATNNKKSRSRKKNNVSHGNDAAYDPISAAPATRRVNMRKTPNAPRSSKDAAIAAAWTRRRRSQQSIRQRHLDEGRLFFASWLRRNGNQKPINEPATIINSVIGLS